MTRWDPDVADRSPAGFEASVTPESTDLAVGLPPPENKKFYPALDGFRAVAVLMVFYQHYIGINKPQLNWGWTGVDFFFVLSGFLITGILYDTRNATHRFRDFYVRRTLRIFPLYYGVLLVGLCLNPIFHWRWHPAWILWPLYLGNYVRFIWLSDFLQGTGALEHLRSTLPFHNPFFLYLGHFWSLCVEEQFYLVWPLVVFYVRDRIHLRNICFVVCFLCLAARVACVFVLPPAYLGAEILYRFTPLRADALLLGGAVALMLRGPECIRLIRLARPGFFIFVFGFLLFELGYLHATHHAYHPPAGLPVLSTIGYTLIDLFAAIVVILALKPGGILYRLLTLKPLRRLGQVSYGFYVFHDIPHSAYTALVVLVVGHDSRHLATWIGITALAGTLTLSFLSFRFFESPFLRLKARYAPG